VTIPQPGGSRAFSRLELLACVLAFALVGFIVLPTLATSHGRNDRLRCSNNLRQIANAVRYFALEHDGFPQWRAQAGEDGNFNHPAKHELWFQYWWLRDSIKDPRILMDPGETRANARLATGWDLGPDGLMRHKNNAVAYILGTDSGTFMPESILVLDRHVLEQGYGGCASGINTAAQIQNGLSVPRTRWLNEVHGPFGNLALADGGVITVDTDGLRRAFRLNSIDGFGDTHLMKPAW
jgi:hypothetical protein